jgi:hypothetical protein
LTFGYPFAFSWAFVSIKVKKAYLAKRGGSFLVQKERKSDKKGV